MSVWVWIQTVILNEINSNFHNSPCRHRRRRCCRCWRKKTSQQQLKSNEENKKRWIQYTNHSIMLCNTFGNLFSCLKMTLIQRQLSKPKLHPLFTRERETTAKKIETMFTAVIVYAPTELRSWSNNWKLAGVYLEVVSQFSKHSSHSTLSSWDLESSRCFNWTFFLFQLKTMEHHRSGYFDCQF